MRRRCTRRFAGTRRERDGQEQFSLHAFSIAGFVRADGMSMDRPSSHGMRPWWKVLVACPGVLSLGCGARSDLFIDKSSPPAAIDAAKPNSDPCGAYSNAPLTCRLHVMCVLIECGRGPEDADVEPTTFACVTQNAPVPDICP